MDRLVPAQLSGFFFPSPGRELADTLGIPSNSRLCAVQGEMRPGRIADAGDKEG